MTDKTQPEALRLALSIDLMDTFTDYQQEELNKAAAELRRQHARIAELEAELEAVGAGGVQALSAAPSSPWSRALEIRMAQGWKLKGDRLPVLYTDTINGEGVGRDDLWLCTTKALAASPTPPAEQQAQPGAVYAELPEPTTHQIAELKACEHGDAIVGWRVEPSRQSFHASMHPKRTLYTTEQARNFADRTHALRMEQAAPKAAPGELSADSLRHQNKLLAETLGACILASGIVRKDIDGFTGPELLHFGEDLRSMLEAAPQQEAQEPTADVQAKIGSNTWDHFGEILPTLKAISRGYWYWGANSRCKYIEIRIDTRDGGCILYDSKRVRISPQQFAHQSHDLGKMDPWPAKNALGDPAPQPAPAPLSRARVKEIMRENGYDGASAQHRADFINGVRHAEIAHGISAALAAQGGAA